MMNYLIVGVGGILGACARHFVFSLLDCRLFPIHTVIVNVAGCFCIGLLSEWCALKGQVSHEVKLLLITGVLGSFTTFSTFALDAGVLMERHEIWKSVCYLLSSVGFGVGAYFAAVYAVRSVLS